MPEANKYIEKAYEALDAAKILFEKEKFNSAVSQAYYSMFYAAKALLSIKQVYPRTHKGVVSNLV